MIHNPRTSNSPQSNSGGSAVGLATQDGAYLHAVASVLQRTDATQRNWRGKRVKLPSGVPFRFVGRPITGPQCVTVSLQIRDEDWKTVAGLGERFAMVGRSRFARVYRDLSVIRVEFTLPPDQWHTVHLSELPHRVNAATIGRKALGPSARVGWDPPHKAMFGSTQSGKTTCMADFILSLARHPVSEYRLIILNPKNDVVLHPFARLPHLAAPMADNYDDSAMLLRWALAEMERRRGDPGRRTRLVVFIDEIAQLIEVRPEVGAIVTQLSQMAGGLNINLVIASQAANPRVFGDRGSLARANFTSRIVFQLPHEQSWLALQVKGENTGQLGGKGDGLAVIGDKVTRFRAALPDDEDYANLPQTDDEPDWPGDDQVAGDRAEWQIPPEQLAYALMVKRSATGLRDQFPIGTDKARMIRDYAAALENAIKALRSEQGK